MKILIASDHSETYVNGVLRTMTAIILELRRSGHAVVQITASQCKTIPYPFYSDIEIAMNSPGVIKKAMEEFNPDALHVVTEGPIGFAARQYALKHGMNFTSAYHTKFPEYLRGQLSVPIGLTYSALRWFHKPSKNIMVSTMTLKKDLEDRSFKNVSLVKLGVDTDLFHPNKRVDLSFKRPIFLSVCRISKEKNLPAFLDLDLPGSKVIVGEGPDLHSLKVKYPEAHFLGKLEGVELAKMYASADVFVFPSKTDTFGLVQLEALASGTPVAAFPVAGPLDLINSDVGVLDDVLQSAALAALKVDRSECRRYAMNFSWKACAEEFLQNLAKIQD